MDTGLSLCDVLDALLEFDVDIFNADGSFKRLSEVMHDLQRSYHPRSAVRRIDVYEQIAEWTRQYFDLPDASNSPNFNDIISFIKLGLLDEERRYVDEYIVAMRRLAQRPRRGIPEVMITTNWWNRTPVAIPSIDTYDSTWCAVTPSIDPLSVTGIDTSAYTRMSNGLKLRQRDALPLFNQQESFKDAVSEELDKFLSEFKVIPTGERQCSA